MVVTDQDDRLLADFSRTAEEYFSLSELRQRLESGRPLRIKYGVDVTAPYLHIGHAVNLWLMRKMQDRGHKVIFLVGDFTTRIGDPTGKSRTRPVIPQDQIEENTRQFIDQARLVLRFDDSELLEIRKNSEWWNAMPVGQLMHLLSMITHSKLIARDMFQRRIEVHEEIYMHEMLYPLLQGYDSVAIQSDLTIIGFDQLFNEMLGRFYQEKFGQTPQVIITTKITPGIDGKEKQSKSLGNYVGLGHSPRDKFGRLMRLPDHLIGLYLRTYTNMPLSDVEAIEVRAATDPFGAKKVLAREIVKLYHGADVAEREQQWFEDTFSKGETPDEIPERTITLGPRMALDLVMELDAASTRSEARRLIQQGALTVSGNRVNEPHHAVDLEDGSIVKIGKRHWYRVRGTH